MFFVSLSLSSLPHGKNRPSSYYLLEKLLRGTFFSGPRNHVFAGSGAGRDSLGVEPLSNRVGGETPLLRDPREGAGPGGFRSSRKVFPERPGPASSVPPAERSEAGDAAEPLRPAGNGAGDGGAAAAPSGRGLGQVRLRAERVPPSACGGNGGRRPAG